MYRASISSASLQAGIRTPGLRHRGAATVRSRRAHRLVAVAVPARIGAVGDAYAGWHRAQSAILLIVLASSAIIFYRVWLLTPNYNTLNLYGAMLVAAGLVPRFGPMASQASPPSARSLVVDGAMIAVGMTFCFLAKPPTAALLDVGRPAGLRRLMATRQIRMRGAGRRGNPHRRGPAGHRSHAVSDHCALCGLPRAPALAPIRA